MEYAEVAKLPEGTVVQDGDGCVWLITKYRDETWMCPFSSEYAVWFTSEGVQIGGAPPPPTPITDTGLTSTGGA
jgi:hypothetical protein